MTILLTNLFSTWRNESSETVIFRLVNINNSGVVVWRGGSMVTSTLSNQRSKNSTWSCQISLVLTGRRVIFSSEPEPEATIFSSPTSPLLFTGFLRPILDLKKYLIKKVGIFFPLSSVQFLVYPPRTFS